MKKLLLLIVFTMFVCTNHAQDTPHKTTKIVKASYDGLSDKGYLFIDQLDESPILFAQAEPEVLDRYDLQKSSFVGFTFRISYGTMPFEPQGNDLVNNEPFKEELIILAMEAIE